MAAHQSHNYARASRACVPACPAKPASIRAGIGRSQGDTIITALIAFRCRAHNIAQSCNSRPCKMRQPQRDSYTNMNTHTDRHNMRRHREKGRRKYARALSHVYICTPQCINDVAAAIERKRSCLHYHRLGLSLAHTHTHNTGDQYARVHAQIAQRVHFVREPATITLMRAYRRQCARTPPLRSIDQ